ncbi:MAG TPA: mercuric reductase [Paraburkholderia sp.]|uniref:mercuric reductase n=1 Tax=Paraburkholderia sp. TaxID=1926495 RepID=UPI002D07D3E3|nr:mercuric reductase [Paraburkholderia sp.]HTR07750.1 mercuric reductase [Paraburkholderia sp.]
MAQRFDAIVIGTGQSGPPLAVRLGQSGRNTAVIERASFGGTCVNVGCTPTMAHVACARAAHVARHAADYGVRIGDGVQAAATGIAATSAGTTSAADVRVDLAFVKARKERIIGASREGVERWLRNTPNVTVLQGHARFTGAAARDGSQLDLEAPEIFINTGTRAQIPAISGLDTIRYETNSTLLALEQLPEHLAICGGSYVALEFAQMFRRFGRAAGIECDVHGLIAVDGQLRTRTEGIWALGDVNGRGAFTHTSYDDFQIVAANLLDGAQRSANTRIPAYAVFVDPPLARVGLSEREGRERGKPALIAKMPMSRVGRARERGETDGFMKAMVDAQTKRILGAAIFGIAGDEAIHTFIDTMTADAPYTTLQYAIHVHPTVSELVPTLFDGLKPLA